MVATLGFVTIGLFLALTVTRRLSVLLALVLVPVATALIGGFGGELGSMVADGVVKVAPVAIMITFAVLYFSLMIDTGLFDPAIRRVLRWAAGDPMRITVGTAVLTLCVALDGDGASTFLITVSALLPIYKRLGMRPLVLSGVVCLGAGVMNLVPWGGPTARAMAALKMDSSELFVPLLPAMAAGIAWVLFAAYMIGRRERARLREEGRGEVVLEPGAEPGEETGVPGGGPGTPAAADLRAPAGWRLWFNLALTAALIVALVAELMPLEVLFVLAFAIAVLVNRPAWAQQRELLDRHGPNVVLVTTMIFAAGVFTGILGGTGMIKEMAEALVSAVPDGAGGLLPTATAVTSMPLSLVFTPDAYYFGVMPVIAETASGLGGDPAEIGRAALLGQMTTGFPLSPLTASTFILVGMTRVELGSHQRFIFGWAFGTTIVMTAAALLTGAITA
ncbi:CitMHS family transporter [Actinomadura madurae]|uniref:CitMHS family transporter n=1 Tax=Actinomadura madurae TaxID=1993 RepID=UPI0020D1FBDB|nr:citrate:proton symporter [Actinomadura madurae]MCP9947054.1 citrate:proton symporter [Actinomadura madurae]MCP9963822.1 citrate:proton symporter [Actinomadura madurae]MCP9976294.1 citrate:proton symporter [Actinomadura madurae]MCQ0012487.1 citrate:proton symporter [Actinomadura madurae]